MTLEQALNEVKTISKVKSENSRIDFNFDNVVEDNELMLYCAEKDITLYSPSSDSPYYWFYLYQENITALIRGVKKEVKISY